MRAKQLLRPSVMLLLAVTVTAATAQPRPCSDVQPAERESARAIGACRDIAPSIDPALKGAEPATPAIVIPVPNIVGLSFDAARDRLAGFTLQRSYRPSGEPGGTVLEQQPAPPARVVTGATIRVVLSDGTLRQAPRVTAAEVDEPPKPLATNPDLRPQPSVVADDAPLGEGIVKNPAAMLVQPNGAVQSKGSAGLAGAERLRVPNVIGMPIKKAQARLGRFKVERRERSSSAPIGRVIEQIPRASARTAAGSAIVLVVSSGPARPASEPARVGNAGATPVTETFELPNVIGRSHADASAALTEFKVERVEIVPSAAPSGQVLAQNPAAGSSVVAGSVVGLQVSDGSLATAAVATPAVVAVSAPTPTPSPVQVDRSSVTFPGSAMLALVAGALLVLGLVALAMRRWLLSRRQPALHIEPAAQLEFSPAEIDISDVPVAEIRFSARLDEGETTIEFTVPLDADETTLEHSRELHE